MVWGAPGAPWGTRVQLDLTVIVHPIDLCMVSGSLLL